jgi:mRNA interferase RelE/StbE
VASYKLRIKESAAKELESISRKSDRQRVAKRIEALAEDPRPPGCKKLSGSERYRVRQGSYRIVYAIEDDELVVYVVKIGDRKSIYRSL